MTIILIYAMNNLKIYLHNKFDHFHECLQFRDAVNLEVSLMDVKPSFSYISEGCTDSIPQIMYPAVLQEQGNLKKFKKMTLNFDENDVTNYVLLSLYSTQDTRPSNFYHKLSTNLKGFPNYTK